MKEKSSAIRAIRPGMKMDKPQGLREYMITRPEKTIKYKKVPAPANNRMSIFPGTPGWAYHEKISASLPEKSNSAIKTRR